MRLCEGQDLIAQRGEACLFEVVAIEHVVGVERDETFRVRMGNVNTCLLDGAEIETLRIDELHDKDAEEVGVAQIGRGDLWKAAQQVVELRGL